MALGDLFIAVNAGRYWLVSSRGIAELKHPDPINGMQAIGVPKVNYDDASMAELRRVFADAP